jgi:hypothetical protein
MTVTSSWDQSTVYGTIDINLEELLGIDPFEPDENTTIQLPRTTTRSLNTQVRVRPGDAILIAGLVREADRYSGSGPGFMKPLFNTARSAETENSELVFLLRPRVIAFVPGTDMDTVPIHDLKRETNPAQEAFVADDITDEIGDMFGNAKVSPPPATEDAADESVSGKASLPAGLSASDMAPAAPPASDSSMSMPEKYSQGGEGAKDAVKPDGEKEIAGEVLPPPAAVESGEPVVLTPPPAAQNSGNNAGDARGDLTLPPWLPSQGGR